MAYGTVNADVIGTSVAGSNLGAGNASLMKNRIINGAMVIDQRNAGASVTPTTANPYTLDRWRTVLSQNSKFTLQQNAGSVTPPVGFTKYIGITSSSAYSVLAGDFFFLQQQIEGFNCADLGWGTANAKTVTLSFQVYSSITGTFGGSLQNSGFNRSYPFTYSIPVANTWTSISITIAGDTTGTWSTDNSAGIKLQLGFGVGSTYSGTAGAWSGSEFYSATGATSVVGTSGATFYVTGVQIEVGSSATGFEYRQYGQELALCQRYYEQSYDVGTVAGTATTTGSLTTFPAAQAVYFPIQFKVQKRAVPTVVGYSTFNGASGNYALNNSSNIALAGIISSGQFGSCAYTGSNPGNISAYLHFTATAEL